MTKRILSLLLALVMVLGMFPAPVFAADGTEATASPTEIPTEAATQPQTEPAFLSEREPTVTTEPTVETEPAQTTAATEPTVAETEPAENVAATEPEGTGPQIAAGNSVAMSNAEKNTCTCPMTDGLHYATCPNYICPSCGTGSWHETCPAFRIGTRVKTNGFGSGRAYADIHNLGDAKIVGSGYFPAVMVVTGVETISLTTYYQISAAEGYSWPDAGVNSGMKDGFWLESKYLERYEEEVPSCPVCGTPGCGALHFWCSVCGIHDCGKAHIYCPACGNRDCETVHTFCSRCGNYDCTEDHGEVYKPETSPVITAPSSLVEGREVTIADAEGTPVDSIAIPRGRKASLSAWCEWESALYQWQIRYDAGSDLWVDIQGQTGKGILVSEGMVMSILESQGAAALRCVMTSGEETRTSDPVSVYIQDAPVAAFFSAGNAAVTVAAGGEADDSQTVNLIIQYTYSTNNTVAASPWSASLPANEAYSNDGVEVPAIMGYTATLGAGYDDNKVRLVTTDNKVKLVLNLAATDLSSDYVINISYQPAPVKVTVEHHRQNVDNDDYTLFKTTELTLVTGSQVGEVHMSGTPGASNYDKDFEGCYNLLYEKPYVAADGSTVVEVRYDRHYYLMTFQLGDMGYGVRPIYARYGADIAVDTPTRTGWVFKGWTLNGANATIPGTMPAENRQYVARWEPGDPVDYTIVYWKENANDNNYSYWTQQPVKARPGTIVSGSDSVAPYVDDEKYFTYNDQLTDKDVEVQGDESTIVNVYYNRNYYTIYFKGYGKCAIEEHTHGTGCTQDLICGENGHTHSAECVRTLVCSKEEHIHDDSCICTLPVHTHGGAGCNCTLPEHTHTDSCYSCKLHTAHERGCYQFSGNASISDNRVTDGYTLYWLNNQTPNDLGIVSIQYYYTTYYVKLGDNWYQINNYNNTTVTLTCGGLHTHGDGKCTYKDTEHTHGDGDCTCSITEHSHASGTCVYDHTAHSHDVECYVYQCGENEHEHVSSCYRNCTKPTHKHNSSNCNSNKTDNTIYVITAKYEQNISAIWPTYDMLKAKDEPYENSSGIVVDNDGSKFYAWSIEGNTSVSAVSKKVTMTTDLCDTSDETRIATALYGANNFYKLYYMFESFDQSSGERGNERKKYDSAEPGVGALYYDSSPAYYQEVYNQSDSKFNQKEITGMNPVGVVQTSTGTGSSKVYYNFLYYTRNRSTLKYQNVGNVVKTVENIMFEQPLKDYKDSSGNLLSDYVPDFPTDSYEPGSRVFAGWYTTPECLPGTEANFDNLTMPNGELTIYAKWEPKSYKVNYYLSRESLEKGENIPAELKRLMDEAVDAGTAEPPANDDYAVKFAEDIVMHGNYLPNPGDPGVYEGYDYIHPWTGYEFIGWFYLEDGEETAFAPDNVPVYHDMDLYAKWSSNVLCDYEIRFAYLDGNGELIYIADPITGSTLAGTSKTFDAKGGADLYEGYQTGYFPNVASHTLHFKVNGDHTFTFLYTPREAVPYTVRYLDKATGEQLVPDKVVDNNVNAVVTENFLPITGYMPDKYQKTTAVVPGEDNVIIFEYEVNTVEALYQINYYIQNLDGQTWTEVPSQSSTITGTIGESYEALPKEFSGVTFSAYHTELFNQTYTDANGNRYPNGINAAAGEALPGAVTFDRNTDSVSGELTGNGMQLNFYYTRNYYPYEFRYILKDTPIPLASPEIGKALYGSAVTQSAKEIVADLDGDGLNEDYRLYEPEAVSKTINITVDGEPLASDAAVAPGQAVKNRGTFEYIRCTQTMTITKMVVDNREFTDPDPDQEFTLNLLIHATNGYHQNIYTYHKSGEPAETGTLSPANTANNILTFTLKGGQSITIEGLPTAEYTVSEQNLPAGFYDSYSPASRNRLTVDAPLNVTVTNTYDPATLAITKTVNLVEDDHNEPERDTFTFFVDVPSMSSGTLRYTLSPVEEGEQSAFTATVENNVATVVLKDGQTAFFSNMPLGVCTVTEEDYVAEGYKSRYIVNGIAPLSENIGAVLKLEQGNDYTVQCINEFPVGDMNIEKTVTKEFYGTPWNGDTFTFALAREDRPLTAGNLYDVYEGDTLLRTAQVAEDGTLEVSVTFDETDNQKLDEESEKTAGAVRTVTVRNLPAGTYTVAEQEATDNAEYAYACENRVVGNLEIPAKPAQTAAFNNKLARPTGKLHLEKKLEAANGFDPSNLPTDTVFCFTVQLMEDPPETAAIEISLNGGEAETKVLANGVCEVTMLADQYVNISGLPIGTYRITEGAIPRYANGFADRNNNLLPGGKDADGCMYTDIQVNRQEDEEEPEAWVVCTNTYPVDRAELVLQNLVTTTYNPSNRTPVTFTYTVTMAEQDADSYSYTLYGSDGVKIRDDSVTVQSKMFTLTLEEGQYAVVTDLPACGYTIQENADPAEYDVTYEIYTADMGEDPSETVNTSGEPVAGSGTVAGGTFGAGKTDTVIFTNKQRLGTLTIRKNVSGNPPETGTFLFHISGNGVDMNVMISGSGWETIHALPLGSYTVTENASWSWRYDAVGDTVRTVTVTAEGAEVIFENAYSQNKWLNGFDAVENLFTNNITN